MDAAPSLCFSLMHVCVCVCFSLCCSLTGCVQHSWDNSMCVCVWEREWCLLETWEQKVKVCVLGCGRMCFSCTCHVHILYRTLMSVFKWSSVSRLTFLSFHCSSSTLQRFTLKYVLYCITGSILSFMVASTPYSHWPKVNDVMLYWGIPSSATLEFHSFFYSVI